MHPIRQAEISLETSASQNQTIDLKSSADSAQRCIRFADRLAAAGSSQLAWRSGACTAA